MVSSEGIDLNCLLRDILADEELTKVFQNLLSVGAVLTSISNSIDIISDLRESQKSFSSKLSFIEFLFRVLSIKDMGMISNFVNQNLLKSILKNLIEVLKSVKEIEISEENKILYYITFENLLGILYQFAKENSGKAYLVKKEVILLEIIENISSWLFEELQKDLEWMAKHGNFLLMFYSFLNK